MSSSVEDPCGCERSGDSQERAQRIDEEIRETLGRDHVRSLGTPEASVHTTLHRPAKRVKEVTYRLPGARSDLLSLESLGLRTARVLP